MYKHIDELEGGRIIMPLVGTECPNSKMMVLRQFWYSSMNLLASRGLIGQHFAFYIKRVGLSLKSTGKPLNIF